MQATLIRNIVHVQAVHGGRKVWVPAPRLHAHPRAGSLRLSCMGSRPPLRALRAYRPQVQACALPQRTQGLGAAWARECNLDAGGC